jgi:zinc transporter ZupT
VSDYPATAVWLRVGLAFALAVAGGAISAAIPLSHRRLCALISLAAGSLLGVTLFSILPESSETMRWWELALALGSGYVVFALISRYVFHVCPACAASHFDETTSQHFREIALALVAALAIHSTMDGIAMAAGHETHEPTGQLDLSIVLAVCAHKVPEGLALGSLLLGAGYRPLTVTGWVAAVEATTLLGGGLGLLWLRGVPAFWVWAVLTHAGGGFVYLATHAVFGELARHGRRLVLASFGAGMLVILLLNLFARAR